MKTRKLGKFKILLEHFEESVREHAWKGGGDPDDIPQIEEDYKRSKEDLLNFVRGHYAND